MPGSFDRRRLLPVSLRGVHVRRHARARSAGGAGCAAVGAADFPRRADRPGEGSTIRTLARRLTTVRTFSPKAADVQRRWHVIDASDVVLGRLASHAAVLLRGKHKPVFAPHVDTGDFVIIVNAAKVALSGNKLADKRAYRHSGYPGGLR